MAAVTSRGRDARHDNPASTSLPAYARPASPTLTNPDMILPDYDRSDSPEERLQSPLLMWNEAQSNDMQFHMPPQNAFLAGPVTPTTPIIYGNGTMLSDIGEVTEVESIAGRRMRRESSRLSEHNSMALRSSPTIGGPHIRERSQAVSRERSSSIDSTSTITTQDHNAHFADFDDAVSVDDINFQGDDEESMASEYVDGTSIQEPEVRSRINAQSKGEDRFSTGSISDRAEEILANAKRRLTKMEGNLSRARSSLYYNPVSEGSTPSPPIPRPATALHDSTPTSPGHSRMVSENGFQGVAASLAHPPRAASALGAAGGYRQPLTSSRSVDALGGGLSSHKLSHQPLEPTLEPLSEDDGPADVEPRRNSSQLPDLHSPTFGSFPDKELTRSVSVTQMRDLKYQMMDLKGKISSLREQAQQDSMKRRSLQSLRNLSPFTHARWDPEFTEPPNQKSPELESPPLEPSWDREVPVENANIEGKTRDYELKTPAKDVLEESPVIVYEEARETIYQDEGTNEADILEPQYHDVAEEPMLNELDDDTRTKIEGAEGIAGHQETESYLEEGDEPNAEEEDEQGADDDGYASEGGDSLYHDTLQNPVSHEDREDAFDYEHFFLHSAMGTLSQQRTGRRGSSGSVSSEDSVETTRGPLISRDRRPSIDTMSSVDTFATATEGRLSRSSAVHDDIIETIVGSSEDSDGPPTAKRTTFQGFQFHRFTNSSTEFHQGQFRRNSAVHRPTNSVSGVARHHPSNSSFESTGTNRSFPLVNRSKLNGGVLTPNGTPRTTPGSTPGGSPDQELKLISESLMNDASNVCDKESLAGGGPSAAIQLLQKEDQILVERLVASLGKSVLGLSEASRASSEARAQRRRLDLARRVLDGMED
ncbi:hypothetical protein G7046_g4993 [Stylonectria norvegica]|nr:hypothetical protein G7046_g4993 [Stylonectria norvegica]